MKIAVINEVSACQRNIDIIAALNAVTDAEVLNIGMKESTEEPQLTYIHTSYMAALLLNAGACDMVIGGCGTGQGFLNAVLQFPAVTCGLVSDPLDAWLFSQINGGNCVSLPLNKGYGWAANINLKYVFEKLFADPSGAGYPPARAESQAQSRKTRERISAVTHKDMLTILEESDKEILRTIARNQTFMEELVHASMVDEKWIEILKKS